MIIKKGDRLDIVKLSKEKYETNHFSKEPDVCILTYKNKEYLIKRIGKCDYKKCNSACCRFMHFHGSKFHGCFLEKSCNGYILKKNCKNLMRSGRCRIFKKNEWPPACKNFPVLLDPHHAVIYKKCSFKFKVIGELI